MLREFLRFDLRYQLRSPLVWVIALAFALLAFGGMTSDSVQLGGGVGNVHRNAPSVIVTFLGIFANLGLLMVVVLVAQPLLRDAELGTDELFFSKPIGKSGYLWGRVLAGLAAALCVHLLIALAIALGSFMPWLDPQRLGPFSLQPYLWAFGVIVIPDLIFTAALLCLLAVTTRRLLAVFLGAMAFLVLWSIAGALTRDIEYQTLAALIDPFANRTLANAMRYWSVSERNTQLPPLSGTLLWNRVLWLAVAAVLFFATHVLFRAQRRRERGTKRARPGKAAALTAPAAPRKSVPSLAGARSFSGAAALVQFMQQLRFDTWAVLRSVPFLVLLAFGLLNFVGGARTLDRTYGTDVYPVTALLLQTMQGSYQFLLILIVAYYAGELIWKERDAKLAEVSDAMPVPSWVPLLAKLGALLAVVLVFMGIGVLAGVVYQLLQSYSNIEPGVYLAGMLVDSLPFVLMAILAVFLQVVSNQKFLGYLLLVVIMILQIVISTAGFEHNLYIYAGGPVMIYSDMNGYGHLLRAWAWFQAYWSVFAALLVVIAAGFWVRGTAPSWRTRWREALRSLRGPAGVALASLVIAWIGLGAWIFYNTNVLNEYLPRDVLLDRQAHFEKEYRKYRDLPQPRIVDVRAEVDIYPEQRRAAVRGRYRLVNGHDTALSEVHVLMDPRAELTLTRFVPADLALDDRKSGYRIYKLHQPMPAGSTLELEFTVERAERGFTNQGMPPSGGGGDVRSPLNYNGTFFNNFNMLPHFGYSDGAQILDRNERRKRGLGDVPRMPKLEDESARADFGFADAHWITFETIVSTSADQIALAPGYLQREWLQQGRRYFHYKMDGPMLPFFCYLSARWQVRRGEWRGMPIEIYYDAKHSYNVERMIEATRRSLDYFTANFSPYQHRQVRILEFPRYARFAQSFANTIPFSEGIGFIADLRDREDIDYVFYVTAHEVAHQWWAHQVIGAEVQGSSMITESLAQYSSLMVMEHEYGREHMRRFLKYELDRYLRGRGDELLEELPLMRVENQPYVHYSKGSLIFYRLRDEIGEQNLNRALAAYIRDKAFQGPPYTTTRELLEYIRAQTPPEKQPLLEELFARIIFYDNRVVAARASRNADGKFDVEIDFEARKRSSDGLGREQALALDDWLEVGVFARNPGERESDEKPLYLERHRITQASGTLKLRVDAQPFDVGIDPYNKLIDRIPDDNRKRLD